ncbi:MAG: aldo/keto reductase, partial [Candidatus Thorarchaeota archaeon]
MVAAKRRLGKTELEVSPIGLGAMQFAGGKGFFRYFLAPIAPDCMDEIVQVALDRGINWIDTAEIYGGGASERAVAHGLASAGKSPGDVIITTKWMPVLKSAKSIQKAAEKSANRLEPYPIDLYLVHQPTSRSSVKAQMDAMADLVDAGKIRAVGVSNFSKEKMISAHESLADRGVPLATNQVQFSLLHRKIEHNGVLEAAKELGVSITAYTPLGM